MLSKAWATLARKMQAKYKKLTNFFYFRVFPGEKPIRFFSSGVTEGYPTMLATLQGSYVAQEHFKVGCPSQHHH